MTFATIVFLVFVFMCINELHKLKEKHFPSKETLFRRKIEENVRKSDEAIREYEQMQKRRYKIKAHY